MTKVSVLAAAGLLCAAASAANAMSIERRGTTLFLSGKIEAGDDLKVRDALDAGGIKIVNLDSSGGSIRVAHDIARRIRQDGLSTVVDGSRSRCNSACTLIFAGGVKRHYVNAGGVRDGLGSKVKGLGYHEGNNFSVSGHRIQSGGASSSMINGYYELGSREAASLITKANYKQMYYISQATALSLGIATSLSPP